MVISVTCEDILPQLTASSFTASSFLPNNKPNFLKTTKLGWMPEPNDVQKYVDVAFDAPTDVSSVTVTGTAKAVAVTLYDETETVVFSSVSGSFLERWKRFCLTKLVTLA